jgi:parallel beta-helix repeat protein
MKAAKKVILMVLAGAVASLILGAARASAWQKDPDTIDPAGLGAAVIAQLLAPNETIGDTDTTDPGTANEPVGMEGDSLTAPPADPADADPGHTYFVDNTPLNGDCPNANYTTIQAGVNASGPGDTVKVCPGTYPEQVRITGHMHDKLKLESLKPLQAVIKWPTVESAPLALVDFDTVHRVTLRGFTITGPFTFPSCSPVGHEGLLVENAFDEHIHHNHITNIQNSDPALYGCQESDAVAIGHRTNPQAPTDTPGSAHVDHNVIDEYQKNGIQAVNNGSFVDADHNKITGSSKPAIHAIVASNGVVVFREAAGEIDHNVVSNNTYAPFPLSTGISVAEDSSGSSEIDHNRVFGNDYGIETDTQNDLEISHNDVFGNLADAITLCGDVTQGCGMATGIVVRKNDVHDNDGSGILLLGAESNLLKSNHVEDNGTAAGDTTDGIRVDMNSSGNDIFDNHMEDNVTHDCHDDSVGGGTGGTGNTWKSDQGDTENRPGLCRS